MYYRVESLCIIFIITSGHTVTTILLQLTRPLQDEHEDQGKEVGRDMKSADWTPLM